MLDEGHLLKNMSSLRYQNLMRISVSILCLMRDCVRFIEEYVITQIPEFNEDLSKYTVFDEGHLLKNMSSLRYQNLMRISVSMLCSMRDIC